MNDVRIGSVAPFVQAMPSRDGSDHKKEGAC